AHNQSGFLPDCFWSRFNDIDGITIRLAKNGGGRDHPDGFLFRQQHSDFFKHPPPQRVIWIVEPRPPSHAARGRIQVGIESEQLTVEFAIWISVGGYSDLHPGFELSELLLRQRKIGIYRNQSLKGHDRLSSVKVLTKIDLPDTKLTCERRAKGLLFNSG